MLDGSAFVLCKADWKQAVERELDRCRAIARQSGMVLEQMTPEQFAGNIPVKSYAELVAMTQDTCFDSLRCCLLGRHYAQNDGFAVTEAGYAAFLQDYAATWHTHRGGGPGCHAQRNLYLQPVRRPCRGGLAHPRGPAVPGQKPAARRGMTHPHETQQEATPMIQQANSENFESLVQDGFVIVDFYGTTCVPL